MTKIRLFTSSDEHISDQTPALRQDNYLDTVLRKISWQHDFASKAKCEAIIRGGDFFHHKTPSKTSHSTILKLFNIVGISKTPTFAAIGNHDICYNNIETLDKSPLGVILQSPSFSRLDTKVFRNKDLSVKVVSVDYDPKETLESLRDKIKKDPDYTYTMAVVHALAENQPRDKVSKFFGDAIFAYEDLDFEGVSDVLVFGHYHKDQGVVEGENTKIVNLGSLTRGSLTFENLTRKPKNSMIDFTYAGISIDQIEVPCADASLVFDLNKKKEIDRELKDISDFVERLRGGTIGTDTNLVSFKDHIKTDYPERLSKLALELLEAAEAGVSGND